MLNTEERNPRTMHIDKMSITEMLTAINNENYISVEAVEKAIPSIAHAVEKIADRMNCGGRMFYIGAGTSGRLGVLDASECPPTFGVPPTLITGIIAGGYDCLVKSSENAEDSYENGAKDLLAHCITQNCVVVGISAAGNAAYVIGALEKAKSMGCMTIALTCNPESGIAKTADIAIVTDTGPEAITGSTRMKAGNAQKMVLNMLSTCAMIKTGKVYENLMINLRPSNEKLKNRVIEIVKELTGYSSVEAEKALCQNDWDIKKAIDSSK